MTRRTSPSGAAGNRIHGDPFRTTRGHVGSVEELNGAWMFPLCQTRSHRGSRWVMTSHATLLEAAGDAPGRL